MNTINTNWVTNVIESNSIFAIGSWGKIFITVWKSYTTQGTIEYMIEELNNFSLLHKNGFGLLTIIQNRMTPPDSESRKKISVAMNKNSICFSGAIMEASGFKAAALRGFLAGLMVLSGYKYPYRIFGSVNDCSTWVEKIVSDTKPEWNIYDIDIKTALEEFSMLCQLGQHRIHKENTLLKNIDS